MLDSSSNPATNSPNLLRFEVHGDSMEPEFLEGDIIVVDPGLDPNSGDYVIAKNGEEATFKQLVVDGKGKFLKPLNPRYPIRDITGKETRIVGVVVRCEREFH